MRMWNVDPTLLCHQHLLGEHKELHMFVGTINKGVSIRGYVDGGLVEVHNIKARHAELVSEFRRRGWPSGTNHQSPIRGFKPFVAGAVDVQANLLDLANRCSVCKGLQQQKESYDQ